jgi:hypothetical protein
MEGNFFSENLIDSNSLELEKRADFSKKSHFSSFNKNFQHEESSLQKNQNLECLNSDLIDKFETNNRLSNLSEKKELDLLEANEKTQLKCEKSENKFSVIIEEKDKNPNENKKSNSSTTNENSFDLEEPQNPKQKFRLDSFSSSECDSEEEIDQIDCQIIENINLDDQLEEDPKTNFSLKDRFVDLSLTSASIMITAGVISTVMASKYIKKGIRFILQ